ncbi:MAG TPA: lipid A phosphate methyltransferase, partial [Bacteroidales bacterium]|nr:lipid A phosphate methyltransferase [Bacteroidales bacterium]
MALIHSFERSGNALFRHRGQIPLFIFITAIPVIFLTDTTILKDTVYVIITVISIVIALLGFVIRA